MIWQVGPLQNETTWRFNSFSAQQGTETATHGAKSARPTICIMNRYRAGLVSLLVNGVLWLWARSCCGTHLRRRTPKS